MPVLVKVSQNKNVKTAAYGKWYGRVVATKTMSYQELCKHMSEHNSVYGEDVCLGVANKLQNCMLEQARHCSRCFISFDPCRRRGYRWTWCRCGW